MISKIATFVKKHDERISDAFILTYLIFTLTFFQNSFLLMLTEVVLVFCMLLVFKRTHSFFYLGIVFTISYFVNAKMAYDILANQKWLQTMPVIYEASCFFLDFLLHGQNKKLMFLMLCVIITLIAKLNGHFYMGV